MFITYTWEEVSFLSIGSLMTQNNLLSAEAKTMISMKNIFINPNISLTKIDSQIQQVGRHNHIPDSEFDLVQLKIGVEIEKEHTSDPEIAKAIAKDHLASECSTYYTRLKKMESECEKDESLKK